MMNKDAWRIWDERIEYGELLAKRATGELPEMESSKALSRFLKPLIQPNDRILDVGCGAGHYLRSLDKVIDVPFSYTGVDATKGYIELARKTWKGRENVIFKEADVFSLPFDDAVFDVIISANLLLHLPSIAEPMKEMVRVTRRTAVFRTPVADRSFRIQEVLGDNGTDTFDEKGEPRQFYYFNLYSPAYLEAVTSNLPDVLQVRIERDTDFEPDRIMEETQRKDRYANMTRMVGNFQANGPILTDWMLIIVDKNF